MANGEATYGFRIEKLETKTDKLDEAKADLKDLEELKAAVNRNTRMVMALAFTIAGSSVAALITILAVFH